jgi:hypothetical protein
MKVNMNVNPVSIDGPTSPKRPTPPPASVDTAAFASTTAINSALNGTPETRPDAVERAKALIADPQYPGSAVLGHISQLLAARLGGDGDGDSK